MRSHQILGVVLLLLVCACDPNVSAERFGRFEAGHAYTYRVTNGTKEQSETIVIEVAESAEGQAVTEVRTATVAAETEGVSADVPATSRVQYELSLSNGEVRTTNGRERLVLLKEPVRVGGSSWQNVRTVLSTQGGRTIQETCSIERVLKQTVLSRHVLVAVVECKMNIDGALVLTRYRFAETMGLIGRDLESRTADGVGLGIMAMSLINIKPGSPSAP
jgi:hypothetical protein